MLAAPGLSVTLPQSAREDKGRVVRQPPPISKHSATFDLSAKYEPIFIQLIRQLAACPPNTWPLPSFPCAFSLSFRNGWPGKPGLTVPWQVADTTDSVRQGTTDPRQGNNPTCSD